MAPHPDSENPNDYAVIEGGGSCARSPSYRFFARFDPSTGVLYPSRKAQERYFGPYQLLALFLDEDPAAPGEDIPVPSFLFLTQSKIDWDPRTGGSYQWMSPFFLAPAGMVLSLSPELVKLADSRFMYDPKALAQTLDPSTLDLLFPNDFSYVEKNRWIFSKLSSSQFDKYALGILQTYRQFIPLPVLKRGLRPLHASLQLYISYDTLLTDR